MAEKTPDFYIEDLIYKALNEESLSRDEILYLLGLKIPSQIEKLFETARNLRQKYFKNNIFVYGFLYLSTYCRNHCSFCSYRATNNQCLRYRKTKHEIINAALQLADSGVNLIDLTIGEDPFYYERPNGFEMLINAVKDVKKQTGLPLMASFGCLPNSILDNLKEAGIDWYACYQETHNQKLFASLRLNQDYKERIEKKYKAMKSGMLIEEGILGGVGESLYDIVDSIEEIKKMRAHQIRIMNFIPQAGTPMQDFPSPLKNYELRIMAVLRLLFPDRLIPASLDVYGIAGLKSKLNAGTNVVTSIIMPQSNMAGVAQSSLDISQGFRTVKGITPILGELGLKKAATVDYISWVNNEKKLIFHSNNLNRSF